ncbi:rab-GTPase-TBC domain-containing protein [Gongronella butleri]|nr:rab-GTPase-TBC domain-containing protein [Gongronella butleri]
MALFANDIDIKAIGHPVPALAYTYFVASSASTERLAESGHLALSAPSQIMGRFQFLKALRHPHLCTQVDIHRDKDRVFVVAEHFEQSLQQPDAENATLGDAAALQKLAQELLLALAYLHDHNILHGCLSPSRVLLDTNSRVKLAGYGLHYMTGGGEDVDFPIGHPCYLSPESVLYGERTTKEDVWALGILLVEQHVRHSFWTTSDLGLIYDSLANLSDANAENNDKNDKNDENAWWHLKDTTTLDINDKVLAFLQTNQDTNVHLRDVIHACLQIDPAKRPSAHELLSMPFFAKMKTNDDLWTRGPVLASDGPLDDAFDSSDVDNKLSKLSLAQIYHLWKLAGGDVALDAAKRSALTATPVIEQLPRVCGLHDELGALKRDMAKLYDDTVYPISFKELHQRLGRHDDENESDRAFAWDANYFTVIDEDDINFLNDETDENDTKTKLDALDTQLIYPTPPPSSSGDTVASPTDASAPATPMTTTNGHSHANGANNGKRRTFSFSRSDSHSSLSQGASLSHTTATSPAAPATATTHTLPLYLREQDIHYQYHRHLLFNALLRQYPASRHEIIHHAKTDIPPVLRGKIWAAILGVHGDVQAQFDRIDKCHDFGSNRQIDVDVPRCHQYHQLLASSAGHDKLRRLLKAWVAANPDLVYWQGLDSLCAPFLTLQFNNEAMAFACLQHFVPRFLKNLFLSDNASVLNEYLTIFRHLISYHDPQLATHLETIGFLPDLYAIPWFLTLFTHVFPLDKIYHLWDRILVGPTSFPLFVGVGILRQIRETLISCEFNDCIVQISDNVPKVDMDKCVASALAMCKVTPPSICARVTHMSQDQVPTHVYDRPLDPHMRKNEKAPRMLAYDLCRILPVCLALDIRNEHVFVRGHLPGAMNVQPQHLKNYASIFKKMHRKYHVVIADDEKEGAEFAGQLVSQGFVRVALLQGGMPAIERLPDFHHMCNCKPQKQTTAEFRGKGTEPPFVIRRCKEPLPKKTAD